VLVVYGRCGAGEIVYLVNLGRVWLCNIMAYELEMVVAYKMTYIVLAACKVVVEADDVVPVIEQTLA
jgi:hypothetical protein